MNGPLVVACASAAGGAALGVAGVHVLAGTGWALIAGAVALIALSAVMFRGLTRGTPT